ncbi:protein kinase domain-containing protein [Catellatospora tritici]|uniref:protein kinase domain-containing protein n=1 Tax=Catellatospora tritici TaxID=2851566 RepID=UPI001C2D63EF|nr:protein kinase [Catellatospora tritici]MBV1850733.1 protein kinase [Catellatospora tritici]MBV1850986.1 protein kinase [Catellatospora tritici]
MDDGPELIDGYRDLVRIGHGGFSVVYRARQVSFDRDVAVKVLMVGSDESLHRRLLREARLTAQLSGHPNIVTVLDAGTTRAGRPYLATELYEHGSLHDRVRADGPLPAAEAARIGVKIAGALAAAHEAGVVHRDVKPGNILLSRYGEPVLADFGVAWLLDGHTSGTMLDVFSPHHVAPETIDGGRPGPAADVYALGSTLYQLVSGRAPYSGEGDESVAAVLWRTVHDPVPRLDCPQLPGLADVLARAMAKDPAARHPDGTTLAAALRALLTAAGPAPAPAAPASPEATQFRPDRVLVAPASSVVAPRRRYVLIGAVAGAAVLLASAVAVRSGTAPEPRAGGPGSTTVTPVDTAPEQARPGMVSAQEEQGSVRVRWSPAPVSGGPMVVQVLPTGTGMRTRTEPVPPGATQLLVGGLDPNTGYCLRVGAVLGEQAPAPVVWSRPACVRQAEMRGPYAEAAPTPEVR